QYYAQLWDLRKLAPKNEKPFSHMANCLTNRIINKTDFCRVGRDIKDSNRFRENATTLAFCLRSTANRRYGPSCRRHSHSKTLGIEPREQQIVLPAQLVSFTDDDNGNTGGLQIFNATDMSRKRLNAMNERSEEHTSELQS